jgi:hypothetical protein
MTRKVYRTAQGKMVDIGALQLRNENVRAVGNMGVNARGDLVDSLNRPIKSRTQQVAKQYNKQTRDVEAPSQGSQTIQPEVKPTPKKVKKVKDPAPEAVVEIPPAPEDFDDNFVKDSADPATEPESPAMPANLPPSGLAAAIARAREIKQEPLKTPRQAAQDAAGVRKL